MHIPLPARIGTYLLCSGLILDLITHYWFSFEYVLPGVGIFTCLLLFPAAPLLIGTGLVRFIQFHNKREEWTPLIPPGRGPSQLDLGTGLRVFDPKILVNFRSDSPRALLVLSLILLLAGVALPKIVDYWYETRTFEPLDLPISCARGHISTPTFHLNVHQLFELSVQFDPPELYETPGCLAGSLRTHWAVYQQNAELREGVSDSGAHWLGSFEAKENDGYRIEIDVLSDTGCLDVYHPRLLLWTSTWRDDQWHEGSHPIGIALLSIGSSLLLFVAVSEFSCQGSQSRAIATYENLTREHLRPRRVSLPRMTLNLSSFSFIASILFLPMYLLGFLRIPPKGLEVHLLRTDRLQASDLPGVDQWTPPVVVRIALQPTRSESKLMVNSVACSWDDLGTVLENELKRRPEHVVYVEGDPEIYWAYAAEVIDVAQGLGAKPYLLTPKTQSVMKSFEERRKSNE